VEDLMEAAYKNKDDIREMVKDIVGTYKPVE
jgi:possible capsular polysaccharide biosynthesis protein